MLVLTRRIGETIVITMGDTVVKLHIRDLTPRTVKLAFDAPQSVTINRLELTQRKGKTNE